MVLCDPVALSLSHAPCNVEDYPCSRICASVLFAGTSTPCSLQWQWQGLPSMFACSQSVLGINLPTHPSNGYTSYRHIYIYYKMDRKTEFEDSMLGHPFRSFHTPDNNGWLGKMLEQKRTKRECHSPQRPLASPVKQSLRRSQRPVRLVASQVHLQQARRGSGRLEARQATQSRSPS